MTKKNPIESFNSEWMIEMQTLGWDPKYTWGVRKKQDPVKDLFENSKLGTIVLSSSIKQKQDSIALLWLTIFFSPAWTYNWSYLPNLYIIDISTQRESLRQ